MGHHGLAVRFWFFCWSDERVVDDKKNGGLEAEKCNDFQAQYLGKHAIRSSPFHRTLLAFPKARIEMDQSGGLTPIKARSRVAVIVSLLTGSMRRGLQGNNGAFGTQ